MATYKAPLRDMKFIVQDIIGWEAIHRLPGTEDLSEDLIDAVLVEAAKFTENVLTPLNKVGDEEGCTWTEGSVKTPSGFKEAYHDFVEGGWPSLAIEEKYGGQGIPEVISMLIEEMICASNISFSLYPGLTRGATSLLKTHGSDTLKKQFLPNLVSGKWGGTMCLTEAHCGTDLGLLKTKAFPQDDGSYHLSGTKIFISSGEHDLTENIIHFVIARTPEGPSGIHGISLFLVPKINVTAEGQLTKRNTVHCDSIEHKMGIKGSSTCVMTFNQAQGYLVGDLYKGVAQMFTMMNNERIAVGNQGLGVSEVSYQNALIYAKDRLQGRSLSGSKFPDRPADPILCHPDVRRMLLVMKAHNEGNRMLAAWVAFHLDVSHRSLDKDERLASEDLVQLMTPIVKAYLTDCGLEVTNLGMQIFGGHGYIRDYGMEQFVRDARIAQIYEGTNGVQALDLVGRKLSAHMGRYARRFFHPLDQFIEDHRQTPELADFIDLLAKSFQRLQQATVTIAQRSLGNPEEVGAGATDYLKMFGLVACGYLWARAVLKSQKFAAEESDTHNSPHSAETNFYQSKIKTARFFYQKILPETSSLLSKIMAGARPVMTITEAEFGPF